MKNIESLNIAKNKHVVEIDVTKKTPERILKTIELLIAAGYEWVRIHDSVKEATVFTTTLFIVSDSYNDEFYIYLE